MSGSPLALAREGPQLRLGARSVPVVLPRTSDPRLHIAAVILTIHVLGQVALDFSVSIPQIAAAILSCAIVEAGITLARERRLVWPASAMLTGSGVALIMREVGTEPGDHWTTRYWWLFAAVAVGSLLSKYLIRWRGGHVFNPSNFGLVVAFLVIGSDRIEPLDFWWGPLDVWLLVAYWVIIAGGVLITERLGLLEMALAFWIAFAVGMGALALSGHCFHAPWSATPVCDGQFWWTVVTSPEILVFLFFMITDPRTVPSGRGPRFGFGVAVAVVSSLLIAPQTTEFGAKVGLLGGLVLVCAARPVVTVLAERVASSNADRSTWLPSRATRWAAAAGGSALALGAIALAGVPAQSIDSALDVEGHVHPRELVPDVERARVPRVSVDPDVTAFGDDIPLRAPEIGLELVRALDVEILAVRSSDPDLLYSVNHGARLTEVRAAADGSDSSTVLIERHFDQMYLTVVRVGGQAGSRLAIDGTGSATQFAMGPDGPASNGRSVPFAETFVLREGADGRWLLVDVVPAAPEAADG